MEMLNKLLFMTRQTKLTPDFTLRLRRATLRANGDAVRRYFQSRRRIVTTR